MADILTIQIPTYQNIQQLCATLSSLMMHTDYPYKIKVINNDGTPEGEKQIEETLAEYQTDLIEVVHAHANKGWMGANNMMLDRCDTPLVCLMNDDVFFLPGIPSFWDDTCRWFKDTDVGAVGPISNFVMGAQNMSQGGVHTISETSLLIGFCVVMRTSAIKEIGGLDEMLPGGDDLDWSIRLRDAGYKLLIDRTAFLYHVGQQTGHRVNPGYWDSEEHQNKTDNALIRKHGVEKWYDVRQARHWKYGPPLQDLFNEKVWYEGLVAERPGKRGLNLGCGHMEIEGVPGLDLAKRGETGSGGRKFSEATNDLTADAATLPVADGSLDYIIAAHVFEHLLDPVATLSEWARALKPGGELLASLPNHGSVNTMLIDADRVHAFVPSSTRNLLEALGWDVTFCEAFDKSVAFGVIARRP